MENQYIISESELIDLLEWKCKGKEGIGLLYRSYLRMKGIIIMRDPNRLENFYEKFKELHKTYCPDWRFGQLIINFMSWYYKKYKRDIFYIEEDKIIKYINEYFEEMRC